MINIILLFVLYAIIMLLVHELGHVIAIYLIGGKVITFKVTKSGIQGEFQYPDKLTFNKYVFFTVNGVILQTLVTICFYVFIEIPIIEYISMFYLSIIAINLVPFSITDGAYIYRAFPASKIKILLWFFVTIFFSISFVGLYLLWKDISIVLPEQVYLTILYFLIIIMVIRRIYNLNKEGVEVNYGL